MTRLDEQAAALLARDPDVVGLQEVSERSWPRWREALADGGLPHVELAAPSAPRRTGVLLAARAPLELLPAPGTPWPESVAAARTAGLAVWVAHVPNSANGWVKVRTMQALAAAVRAAAGPRAVCGDLNTPRRETPEGELVTFARDSRGRLRPERGEEWDAAEAALFTSAGLVDAFRSLHGYAHREPSWTWRRFPRSGYRLDHVLVSPDVTVQRCEYRHEWRTSGLSDHSGLEADLSPP